MHFLLRRDTPGRIRFAPLQGTLARKTLGPRGRDPAELDTVYALADWQSPSERVLERSRAVLHAVGQLGGAWRLLAGVASAIPAPVADALYRFIARYRYRLFGQYDACPVPPPEWKSRFVE